MKILVRIILTCIFLTSYTALSQNEKTKKLYVRVYDLLGNKIEKGTVLFVNDTLLALNKKSKVVKIKVSTIGEIKTKRSTGEYIGTGALVGGISGAVVGFVSADEETTVETRDGLFGGTYTYESTSGTSPATGAFIGAGAGSAAGALVGLGISLFNKSNAHRIEGDLDKWKLFLETENLKM